MAFSFWNKNKKNESDKQQVTEILLTQIVPNRFQPRQVFNSEKLAELAETLKEHGLLQPIIVREYEPEHYEIIAGERRFRAAGLLGWEKIPALVKQLSDNEAASLAVVENLQREGLTVIEEAKAYQELMQLNKLTQNELAQAIGKSQSFVANKLRLLKLSNYVQQALLERKVLERHGRSVLGLDEPEQIAVIKEVIARRLTVKETEALIKQLQTQKEPVPKKAKSKRIAKGALHDTRIAVNTIKKSVKMISDNGMKLKTHEEDVPGFHRIIIEIPVEEQPQEKE
ncbi:nucleoid occlusion protein [Liquorilactobacillus satsumensis]|uniref:nucleoid occlusion protein n=1 Tax=Liquorilactobacillus satsumensis TaxID=259059 RepID=UPI001E314F93|nr:nucleoid occlusion protein [Liquorilactobacillus satsumensis]MCC7666641.1 nucleoid occlusion protein [Liquorilactobacillus satsumensis]MCP9357797.1 nucleoid occlusion protein [Liquorilactobacillus satsumensis]MCP9371537.1 nucleoid occlusion protein [Liquorilactobacillus satsumensis]